MQPELRWRIHEEAQSLPRLTEQDDVLLWCWPGKAEYPAWVLNDKVLSSQEKDRLEQYGHTGARRQFQRVRVCLRWLLAHQLGLDPDELRLEFGQHGKPKVVGKSLQFNVSHKPEMVVFALSQRPVGVDVETLEEDRDFLGLVQRYFNTDEQAQFATLTPQEQVQAFYRGWTCKEALLKGIGTGTRDLEHVGIDLLAVPHPPVLRMPAKCGTWQLRCWQPSDDTVAAVGIVDA